MLPLVNYEEVRNNTQHFYYRIRGQRQKPPFDLVTSCEIDKSWGYGDWFVDSWYWGPPDSYGTAGDPNLHLKAANQSYDRFVAKLGDSSSFGATLTAELKETLGMVTGTVLKLVSAARDVRKLRFASAARTLGLPYRERTITKKRIRRRGNRRRAVYYRRRVMTLPTGREVQKTLANGWLMYSYGIKPLMDDLYNAMDVLQRPWPDELVKATGFSQSSRTVEWTDLGYHTRQVFTASVRVHSGAYVSVNNPNLWLLNKMGLVNPVQWANEAIPFSFVVDWFSNLSSVIGSLSDFVGLNIKNPWTSTLHLVSQEETMSHANGYFNNKKKNRAYFVRSPSLPSPKLVFAYERVNWRRALNAISLLIGFLPSK